MRVDLIRAAWFMFVLLQAVFASEALSGSDQPAQGGSDLKNLDYKRTGQMDMSLATPLSRNGQAASDGRKDDGEATPLTAKENQINELDSKISEMQALIKNLQASLKQTADVPVAASAVPTQAVSAPAQAVSAQSAVTVPLPATAAVSFSIGLKNNIWLLLPALLLAGGGIFWYRRSKAVQNRGIFEDSDPHSVARATADSQVGMQSIKTPAYVDNLNEQALRSMSSGADGLPASMLQGKHVIEPAEVDSMIEEAELYAIHGHLNNAMEILNNIILQYPEKVEVWLLLLSIFRSNTRQFEVIARKFLQTIGRNDTWRDVQEAGRSIDPNNPLYFDANSQEVRNKPNKRRLLGNILLEMQAISERELESSLLNFDHLRDGRLGAYMVVLGLIKQNQLEEALKVQEKESPRLQPVDKISFASLGRPDSISDVLVRMGVVTEPELEHVLADFDPKRHGHCGNYLVSSGLITKKQLHAALLQQLGGAMDADMKTEES